MAQGVGADDSFGLFASYVDIALPSAGGVTQSGNVLDNLTTVGPDRGEAYQFLGGRN